MTQVNSFIIAGLLLVLLGLAYQTGWSKSRSLASANGVKVHSRPQYHGALVAIWALVPALLIVALYAYFGGGVTHVFIVSQIPTDILTGLTYERSGPELIVGLPPWGAHLFTVS